MESGELAQKRRSPLTTSTKCVAPSTNGALLPPTIQGCGKDYLVVGVSWGYAYTYCQWVGGALPTEAQWEYATRGPEANRFPWEKEGPTCDLGRFRDCGGDAPLPMAAFRKQ